MNPRETLKEIWRRHFEVVLIGGMALVMLVYVNWISWYRINNFLTFWPQDTGNFNSMFWSLMHGGGFGMTPFMDGVNYFAQHSYFYIILLLPFYFLFPNGIMVFWLKNLFVIGSVIPIHLIAKKHLKQPMERILVCATWLTLPFLASLCHVEPGGAWNLFPILVCYYFYIIQKFRAFAICSMVTLLFEESLSFLFIAWALLALLDRRPFRWSLCLMFLGTLYFSAYHCMKQWLWPDSTQKLNLFEYYYGHWGNSAGSCVIGMLSHPLEVAAFLTDPGKWFYIFYVTFPFLPFLFLRPRLFLLAAPNIAIYFLMSKEDEYFFNPIFISHFVEICAFSFLGFLELISHPPSQQKSIPRVRIILGIGIFTAIGGSLFLGEVSPYLLVLTGLKPGDFFCLVLFGLCPFLLNVFVRQCYSKISKATWVIFTMMLLIFIFRGTLFQKSILSVESYIFKLAERQKNRNVIARSVIEGIPPDKWMSVQKKYSIVASNRLKLVIYNGTDDIASHWYYSDSIPEYVFLDTLNYESIFWASALDKTWNKTPIWNLLNDHQHWELIFFYDGLYLLKRIIPSHAQPSAGR